MKLFAIFAGILAGFLFGIATPFSKILLTGLNSFQLAGLLYLGAALAMTPYAIRRDSHIRLLFKSGNRFRTIGIIVFGGFAGPLFLMAGLKLANAASVSIWLNMELVATAILGVFLFKDSLDKNGWIAVGLTVLAGIITSIGEGSSGLLSASFITAACICWGIDNHLTALVDGASPQIVTFVKGLVAGLVNLAIGTILLNQNLMIGDVAPAIIVGMFSYGISIVLYVLSAQNIGATRSQILFSTAPVWGVIFSYFVLGEAFQWNHIFSIVLLMLAVIITNLLSHHHSHVHPVMEHLHFHQHNDGHHDHRHEEKDSGHKWHSHQHKHEPLSHDHPHDPDLHHRHEHE